MKSQDPLTGLESAKTVTATIKRLAPAVVHLVLTDSKSGQSETLTCTPEHPLFVSGRGWVEAGSLGIGTSIVSRAGPALTVQSVTWEREVAGNAGDSTEDSKPYTVYNLTVEDDHTYFVGSLGGGTWVHNAGCGSLFNEDELGEMSTPTRHGDLLKNMGERPYDGLQAHHELPWKFREWFAQRGLNVNNPNFGKWVDQTHQSWSQNYESAWQNFIQSNSNAGKQETLDYLDSLRETGLF